MQRLPKQKYTLEFKEAKRDTFDYIEPFYNRKRRHSTLDYLSPAEYYQRWIHQHKQAA